VTEGDAVVTGSPGRPSPVVAARGDGAVVLAADVKVSRIIFAVVGLGGTVHQRVEVPLTDDSRGVAPTVDRLVELIGTALAESPDLHVVGLGVSVAGIVRVADGFVHLAPNLGWVDVPLANLLVDRLSGDLGITDLDVVIGNEADLGALAEHVRGAGSGTRDMVYVSGEIGVGGGIVVDGRPLVGRSGYAGEIGHMVVNPEGRPCHCGSIGCWETEIGQRALLRHMGWADGGDHEVVDAIMREASAGSQRALDAFAEVGTWLGIGLASLINVLNPQRVVLGGVFARAFSYLIDAARVEVDRRSLGPARAVTAITPATLGEDSSLVGAAEMAFTPVLADPTLLPLHDTDVDVAATAS
jgi:predicted NBD/HSP70 family sugar kinase